MKITRTLRTALRRFVPLLAIAALFPIAGAATITKANNTDDLNLPSSWVGGVVPGPTDVALWDSTVTDENRTKLDADLSWQGIEITNPGGTVFIEGPNTLTLGVAGIDASTAEKSLSLKAPVTFSADQLWRFNGKTLFHNFGDTNTTITNAGHTLTIENGTVQISGNLTGAGSLTRSGDNSQTIIRGICSYTGGTTIESGVFTIGTGTIGGDGEISPSSLITGSSRGTLRFWRTDDFTFPNTITGDIKVEKRGPGIVTLTGRNDFTGTATVLEGELVNKEPASTPTGSGKTP